MKRKLTIRDGIMRLELPRKDECEKPELLAYALLARINAAPNQEKQIKEIIETFKQWAAL